MRTANPALKTTTFSSARAFAMDDSQRMTVQGAATKTLILLLLAVGAAIFVWTKFFAFAPEQYAEGAQAVTPWLIGGSLGGLIVAFIVIFKPGSAPVLAPAYAALQGLALGGISAVFEASWPGIVVPAVGLTFGTLFVMMTAYKTGLIRVTDKFRMGVISATGAIFLFYLLSFLLGLFGVRMPLLHGGGLLGIGISVAFIVVAALNLVLDFDLIEQGARSGAPKHMEWYGAFALMVTLVWLYMEMLRLLAKLRSRR